MDLLLTIIYAGCLLYIFIFSLGQLHLAWIYTRKNKKEITTTKEDFKPFVTIQLPIYNEKYVVERLLDAIASINYPKEKIEIQILDDSTDETTQLIVQKIESLRAHQIDFKLIHRENRKGFKAGALAYATPLAKGDFIAIFDADFIPQPDFLEKTIYHFENEKIGVVQTRWGHLNQHYSILTQLQAFGLDAHFSVEQVARNKVKSFINFNGTCGVWRKQAITDAGGWHDDTLTEDLDLSYRAQLKGWEFLYLEDVATPGELPVIMSAIKSQQYRWNKGGAETARKNFIRVLTSKQKAITKFHAFCHLFNSSVFITLFIASLLSVPMLFIKASHPSWLWIFHLGNIFMVGFLSIGVFYWVANKRFSQKPINDFIKKFLAFLSMSMGLSLHNGLAVSEGLLGRKTPFIRTPKFNVHSKTDSWKKNVYIKNHLSFITIVEGVLAIYFIVAIVADIMLKDYGLIFFHTMLSIGFASVFYFSVIGNPIKKQLKFE